MFDRSLCFHSHSAYHLSLKFSILFVNIDIFLHFLTSSVVSLLRTNTFTPPGRVGTPPMTHRVRQAVGKIYHTVL